MMFRNRSLASCSRSFFMATGRCKWDFPYRFDSPTVAEIGSTWYGASFQRTGVNTECKLLMLAHAFDSWNTIRVTLKTDARNIRSRYAIQRLGATFEGIRRAHLPARWQLYGYSLFFNHCRGMTCCPHKSQKSA